MKGIVFNLLEEVVVDAFGAGVWEQVLADAGVPGVYTSLGNYADADMHALVAAAAVRLGMQPGAVLQWFGQRAMPLLKQRYPHFFDKPSAREFLLSVNSNIHPEGRKLYAGSACPFFLFRDGGAGALIVRYQSSRNLIDLAHGFVLGAAALWREAITVVRGTAAEGTSDQLTIRWAAA